MEEKSVFESKRDFLYVSICEKVVPNYMFGIDHNLRIYGQVFRAQYQN